MHTPAPSVQTASSTATPFSDTLFKATHNSYSGGSRGSIPEQLDAGVRFIELDINDDDFASIGDYRIGHGRPGSSVYHGGGNPASNLFSDWLQMIVQWSVDHPGHAPITLGLDMKNNLSSVDSPAEGNLSALNELVAENLGSLLFTSTALGDAEWPTTTTLNDRIMVVLSGNESSRKAYLSDQGKTPAVAINGTGWVVEVHKSQVNSGLWYWTGRYGDDGLISWLAHGKMATGSTPAVAINNAGQVVLTYEDRGHIYSCVGLLGDQGAISWGDATRFANGNAPSLAFTDLDSNQIVEIHQGDSGNQQVVGTIGTGLWVGWGEPTATSKQRFPTTSASSGGDAVSVTTGTDSAGTDDTLLYSTPAVQQQRIRYQQLCFVEFQKGNAHQLENDRLWFYAASASSGNLSWAGEQRSAGKIVRLWGFGDDDTSVNPPINFPATDTPYETWYLNYCEVIGTDEALLEVIS